MKIGSTFNHEIYGPLKITKKRYSRMGNKSLWIGVDENGEEHELDGTEKPAKMEKESPKFLKEAAEVLGMAQGPKGEDADEDYIIEAVIPRVLEQIRQPENGKDGADADVELIIKEMIPLVMDQMPRPKELNEVLVIERILSRIKIPQDGKPGEKGKDGSPDTPVQVKDKLESLKGDERLDASAIKNLPKPTMQFGGDSYTGLSKIDSAGTPGTLQDKLVAGTNVTITKVNDTLRIASSGGVGGGQVDSIVAGNNIDVDATDPLNPIISVEALTLADITGTTAWRVFYADASGVITQLALGADGTFLKSNGASSAPSFAVPAGSGDVSKVGTPVNNQVGVWTGDGTLEGDADLTFDGTVLSSVGLLLSGLTASELVITDGSKNLVSAAVATYPSLTELTYVKGVTSAIQTQLGGKVSDAGDTMTGNLAITIPNSGNALGLTVTQNDTTNNPRGASITNTGTGNALLIDQNGAASTSTSVGGALLVENTGNSGAGVVIYSNHATATGRLLSVRADNTGFATQPVYVENDGASHAVSIVHNSTGSNALGMSIVSINQNDSSFGVSGQESAKGTAKITHNKPDGVADTNAAALSISLDRVNAGETSASQGIFLDTTHATTGKLLNIRNNGVDQFVLSSAGVLTVTGNIVPTTSDGASLGTTSLMWSDLFLASGAVINFNNGDILITHAADQLIFSGASSGFKFANNIVPNGNDGSAIGTTGLQWSDLFLAEGGVINWDNGDVTITQTGNVIAVAGGDLQVATAGVGTNADSVPTISSTNTLTNKRNTRRLTTTNAPGATPTTNTDNVDVMNFTGLGTAITSMTTNLSGTPVDGDLLEFRFTDDGTARAITWGASFAATTVALPTTTVISTMLRVGFEYSGSTWKCIATC